MQVEITLDEKDITEAVDILLARRGLKIKGAVRFVHTKGDRPGDVDTTTVGVSAEIVPAGQR